MRDWLSHRVVSSPDDTALVRAEDGEAWTYTDLDRLVSETAGCLAAHGIEAGDTLGVLTPPYVGTVGLIHAAMRIGATFVPLGEGLTERELAERIDGVDLSAVVCAESTENKALGALAPTEDVPVFSVDDPDDEAVVAVHDAEPKPVDPASWEFDETLCVLFTSGTTGDPKPVPLTVGNVYSSAVASAFRLGVDGDDRWLVSLALHHMGGLAPVYRCALYGTTLILREGFDPGGTADDIDTYDVTGVSLVPTMLRQMLDRRGTLSDSLRVVLLGGAPAADELLERCRDYSIPVYPTYGMTEAASQIATATPRQTRDRLDTVGRPIFGTDVTVVDEDGSAVDPGETGEVVVDGPMVTRGYIDTDSADGTLDRSAFGPHGLHTGDVGLLDEDGFLYVLNRLDDRIISGGENVEPGEVVDVLCEFSPIEDVAVVGLDDDVWGERVSALITVGDRFRAGDADRTGDLPNTGTPDSIAGKHAGRDESAANGDTGAGRRDDADGGDDADSGGSADGEGGADGGETPTGSQGRSENGSFGHDGRDPGAEGTTAPVDEGALMAFASDRLAGFKLPKTVAYVDELPRTVSGTVDRDAVKTILRSRGRDPRDELDDGLEMAGFKPADPTDPADPPESESEGQESDSGGGASDSGGTVDDGSGAADDGSGAVDGDGGSDTETGDGSVTDSEETGTTGNVVIPDAEEADRLNDGRGDTDGADASAERDGGDETDAPEPDEGV